MSSLSEFTLHRPASLAEAAALLEQPNARVMGGGTDLLPNLRRGLENPGAIIDLCGLPGFAAVERTGEGGLLLGAGLTLESLARDALVAQQLPALAAAAASVAGPAHRSAATLGGNLCQDTRCVYYNQSEWWRSSNGYCLKRGGTVCHVAPQGARCHAAFSSDIAPVLLVLDAQVELVSARGSRWQPLQALYRDDGAAHLTLPRDELLARVRVPLQPEGQRCGYRKARVRGAVDFPLAALAVALRVDAGRVQEIRVGLSGTNSNPLLLQSTSALAGLHAGAELLERVGKLVQQQARPMRTTTTPSNYRRQVAAALARELVEALMQESPTPAAQDRA